MPHHCGTFDSDVVHGVDRGTVIEDGEVQVGTVTSAAGSHVTDELSLRYILSLGHDIMCHMRIKTGVTVSMIDGHIFTICFAVSRYRNYTTPGCINRSSHRICQVHTVMEFPLPRDGVSSISIGGSQLSPGAGSAPALARDKAGIAAGATRLLVGSLLFFRSSSSLRLRSSSALNALVYSTSAAAI